MAGRPRKIIELHTGAHTKAEKESRMEQEKELKLDRKGLVPPLWLSEKAAAEFRRVVREAAKIDILDNLDLSVLAIYADAYDKFVLLNEIIENEGCSVEVQGVKNSYTKVNPALVAQNMYVDRIYKASAKLGLATTDRLKLVVPVKAEKKEQNPYFKFLDADG